MKLLFLFLLVLNSTLSQAQVGPPEWVRGRQYRGVIFGTEYSIARATGLRDARYRPTAQEVAVAERLLRQQLKALNSGLSSQGGGQPVIHRSLGRYRRQYFGLINASGEKVIYINCVWGRDAYATASLGSALVTVLDGGSQYWNVKVNLTRGVVYDLAVNGVA
ncbi:hypothetical protein [Hymenobacter sp. B81]|uniref:hypothetical protein n=1 Tax=Hymenobacter sp. B81 TaxID=3344878 RepID=UPI0037DC8A75